MISPTLLKDAAQVLELLAQGRRPDDAQVLAGVVALDALQLDPGPGDLDLRDAALELIQPPLQSGRDLDAAGRARAADLARRVRVLVDTRLTG